MTSEETKRQTRGAIVRGTVAELKARQLFDAVRARTSPNVQAIMDDPPKPFDWISSPLWEEIIIQTGHVAGRDTVREISHALTRTSGSVIVGPVIRAVFRAFGTSPGAMVKRINTLTFLQFRGLEAKCESATERSASVVLRYPEPVHDFVFAGWEGAYMYGKELTGAADLVVEKFEIFDGGKAGRVRIRW